MNRRNLFFALKRAATQNEIVVNGFIFDEPFSLQSILEQHASKFRNKKMSDNSSF